MEKGTRTCFVTRISPFSFSHRKLYSLGCGRVVKPNFSTKVIYATLVQLPLSMIIPHTLSQIWHRVWKISRSSSLKSICSFRTRCTTNKSPLSLTIVKLINLNSSKPSSVFGSYLRSQLMLWYQMMCREWLENRQQWIWRKWMKDGSGCVVFLLVFRLDCSDLR